MTVSCLLLFVVVAIIEVAQYGTEMYDFLPLKELCFFIEFKVMNLKRKINTKQH